MKSKKEYFFCSPRILSNVIELEEIDICIDHIKWEPEFEFESEGKIIKHQTAYNKAFCDEFKKFNWDMQPLLFDDPKLIGDFKKNDIFVEIQFGNSATLYRDYYKFHYGLTHNLLSLAVLIVPCKPKHFFPIRNTEKSVSNMAEFDLAYKYYKLLPIPVPILLIGLLPEN
jgi:hypothetical protein